MLLPVFVLFSRSFPKGYQVGFDAIDVFRHLETGTEPKTGTEKLDHSRPCPQQLGVRLTYVRKEIGRHERGGGLHRRQRGEVHYLQQEHPGRRGRRKGLHETKIFRHV